MTSCHISVWVASAESAAWPTWRIQKTAAVWQGAQATRFKVLINPEWLTRGKVGLKAQKMRQYRLGVYKNHLSLPEGRISNSTIVWAPFFEQKHEEVTWKTSIDGSHFTSFSRLALFARHLLLPARCVGRVYWVCTCRADCLDFPHVDHSTLGLQQAKTREWDQRWDIPQDLVPFDGIVVHLPMRMVHLRPFLPQRWLWNTVSSDCCSSLSFELAFVIGCCAEYHLEWNPWNDTVFHLGCSQGRWVWSCRLGSCTRHWWACLLFKTWMGFFLEATFIGEGGRWGKPTVYLGDSCICGLCISYGTSASTQEGEQLQKPPPRRRGPAPAHCCSALVAFCLVLTSSCSGTGLLLCKPSGRKGGISSDSATKEPGPLRGIIWKLGGLELGVDFAPESHAGRSQLADAFYFPTCSSSGGVYFSDLGLVADFVQKAYGRLWSSGRACLEVFFQAYTSHQVLWV